MQSERQANRGRIGSPLQGDLPAKLDASESAGKPRYTDADLDIVSFQELAMRLKRIDNETALEIANHLYQNAVLNRPVKFNFGIIARIFQVNTTADHLAEGISENIKLRDMCRTAPKHLLTMLNKMREINYGTLVIDGPGILQESVAELSPWRRLFFLSAKLKSMVDVPRFLTNYYECLIPTGSKFPWQVVELFWSCCFLLGLLLPQFFNYYQLSHPTIPVILQTAPPSLHSKIWPSLLIVLLPAAAFFMMNVARRFRQDRLLALYISFTDEFVDNGEEQL